MSKISRADSKARFRTGMYPTQADFENLHDSYVHKDDTIPLEQVGTNGATVVSLLNQKANSSHTHEIADVNGLQAFINKVNTFLGTVDASDDTINRWKEIEAFLQGITDTETLTGLLQDLKSEIEGNLAVDSALSATSEKALQNKVLYDELRITEQSGSQSTVTIDETTYPIEVIDANDFDTCPDCDSTIFVIPPLDTRKAYKIIHSNDKDFIAADNDTYVLRFCGDNANDFYLGHVGIAEITSDGRASTGSAINSAEYWNEISFDEWIEFDGESFYGVPVDGYGEKITRYDEATETTGSASVIKSLKTKIAELEARLAAVPTNYLEFTFDMSAYASAEVGKVVLYLGATTPDFTHCFFYEKTASGWKNARVSPVIQ